MNTTTELAMTNVNVLKSVMDWAISSQASWGQDEGSTTRPWSPERMVKAHERGSFVELCNPKLNSHMFHVTGPHMTNVKYYYVYKIINLLNNKIYIGCHQTIDLNDGYMGSGKYILRAFNKYGIENFTKEILQFYPDQKSMFEAEARIVNREFIKRNDNYNLSEGGRGGFKGEECYQSISRSKKIRDASKDRVMVRDGQGNVYRVSKNDAKWVARELVGVTKGKATVKDAAGNILKIDVDDPRIKSGELVGTTKGMAMVKDSLGNRYQVSVDDPRIKSGELVGITKGHKQTQESNDRRSAAMKGVPRTHIYASCVVCKKSTSITNIIRWHYSRCFTK